MSRDRFSGAALILGALATLVVMTLHPTAHDLFSAAGRSTAPARLNLFVHALAIASAPVLFVGAMGLNRRFPAAHPVTTSALVFWGFAMVGVMLAATASGLLAPKLIEWIAREGAARPALPDVLAYNGQVNQAFAKVHVAMSSFAILLWSSAIFTTRAFARSIGWFGALVAVAVLAALFAGRLTLDVHGFGIVIVLQAAWLILVATQLMQSPRGMHSKSSA